MDINKSKLPVQIEIKKQTTHTIIQAKLQKYQIIILNKRACEV